MCIAKNTDKQKEASKETYQILPTWRYPSLIPWCVALQSLWCEFTFSTFWGVTALYTDIWPQTDILSLCLIFLQTKLLQLSRQFFQTPPPHSPSSPWPSFQPEPNKMPHFRRTPTFLSVRRWAPVDRSREISTILIAAFSFVSLFSTAFCNLCICNMRWLFRRPAAECGLCQQDGK